MRSITKLDIIIKVNGVNVSLTKHIQKNEEFILDTEKYPDAKLVSIKFRETTLVI